MCFFFLFASVHEFINIHHRCAHQPQCGQLWEFPLFFSFSLAPSSYFTMTIDCNWFFRSGGSWEIAFSLCLTLDFLGSINSFIYIHVQRVGAIKTYLWGSSLLPLHTASFSMTLYTKSPELSRGRGAIFSECKATWYINIWLC